MATKNIGKVVPVKGVDYFTESERDELVNEVTDTVRRDLKTSLIIGSLTFYDSIEELPAGIWGEVNFIVKVVNGGELYQQRGMDWISNGFLNKEVLYRLVDDSKLYYWPGTPHQELLPITVEEPLNLIEVTYSELVELRDNGELKPGMQYRITDYNCNTQYYSTQAASAEHYFDIVVVADTANILNKNARAIAKDGDTYFVNDDISKWKLQYSLDSTYHFQQNTLREIYQMTSIDNASFYSDTVSLSAKILSGREQTEDIYMSRSRILEIHQDGSVKLFVWYVEDDGELDGFVDNQVNSIYNESDDVRYFYQGTLEVETLLYEDEECTEFAYNIVKTIDGVNVSIMYAEEPVIYENMTVTLLPPYKAATGMITELTDSKNNYARFDFKNIKTTLTYFYTTKKPNDNLYFLFSTISSSGAIQDASVMNNCANNRIERVGMWPNIHFVGSTIRNNFVDESCREIMLGRPDSIYGGKIENNTISYNSSVIAITSILAEEGEWDFTAEIDYSNNVFESVRYFLSQSSILVNYNRFIRFFDVDMSDVRIIEHNFFERLTQVFIRSEGNVSEPGRGYLGYNKFISITELTILRSDNTALYGTPSSQIRMSYNNLSSFYKVKMYNVELIMDSTMFTLNEVDFIWVSIISSSFNSLYKVISPKLTGSTRYQTFNVPQLGWSGTPTSRVLVWEAVRVVYGRAVKKDMMYGLDNNLGNVTTCMLRIEKDALTNVIWTAPYGTDNWTLLE